MKDKIEDLNDKLHSLSDSRARYAYMAIGLVVGLVIGALI